MKAARMEAAGIEEAEIKEAGQQAPRMEAAGMEGVDAIPTELNTSSKKWHNKPQIRSAGQQLF